MPNAPKSFFAVKIFWKKIIKNFFAESGPPCRRSEIHFLHFFRRFALHKISNRILKKSARSDFDQKSFLRLNFHQFCEKNIFIGRSDRFVGPHRSDFLRFFSDFGLFLTKNFLPCRFSRNLTAEIYQKNFCAVEISPKKYKKIRFLRSVRGVGELGPAFPIFSCFGQF